MEIGSVDGSDRNRTQHRTIVQQSIESHLLLSPLIIDTTPMISQPYSQAFMPYGNCLDSPYSATMSTPTTAEPHFGGGRPFQIPYPINTNVESFKAQELMYSAGISASNSPCTTLVSPISYVFVSEDPGIGSKRRTYSDTTSVFQGRDSATDKQPKGSVPFVQDSQSQNSTDSVSSIEPRSKPQPRCCDKTFPTQKALDAHKKTHTPTESKHTCNQCNVHLAT